MTFEFSKTACMLYNYFFISRPPEVLMSSKPILLICAIVIFMIGQWSLNDWETCT